MSIELAKERKMNEYEDTKHGCACGCGPHCGHSCMTDDCDCTECDCYECKSGQSDVQKD